jgi:hypothetical protein
VNNILKFLGLDFIGDIPLLRTLYYIAVVIFVVLDIMLFVGFVYAFRKSWALRPPTNPFRRHAKKIFTLEDELFLERWMEITKKVASGVPDSIRLALIDADKLTDDVLKQFGLEGEHMADRLEQIHPDELRSLERLWRAHRIRNELVHTPGFYLSPEAARNTLDDFEAFLKEVKVLNENHHA